MLKHRKQCWQATGVGGQDGENEELCVGPIKGL